MKEEKEKTGKKAITHTVEVDVSLQWQKGTVKQINK